jgi:hypothetical protein
VLSAGLSFRAPRVANAGGDGFRKVLNASYGLK